MDLPLKVRMAIYAILNKYDLLDSEQGRYIYKLGVIFCKAASEQSRKYICHAENCYRRGITADHPFIIWLLQNAIHLRQN